MGCAKGDVEMFAYVAKFGVVEKRATLLAMRTGLAIEAARRVASDELESELRRAAKETAAMQEATIQPPAAPGTPENGKTAKSRPIIPGRSSAEIIDAFKLEPETWREKLKHIDKAAKSYKEALAQRGGRGKSSHTWHPARFAICLLAQKEKNEGQLKVALATRFPDSLPEFIDLKIEMGS